MDGRSNQFPFSLEQWAIESVQGKPSQRTLMTDHMRRTLVRFGLLATAILMVMVSGLVLEHVRLIAGGGTVVRTWRWTAGMLPGLLALAAVLGIAANFVQTVHGIRDPGSALRYVWLLVFGRAPGSVFDLQPSPNPVAPYPSITVQHGRIAEKDEDTLLARLGGPGTVTIYNDSAVFLERFGRFTRVAGPGKVFLQRFERIHEVLDLRPQERTHTVTAMTKDGIPVQAEVQVRYQLARPPASLVVPTPDVPHPVYEWALVRAGRCHSRTVKPDTGDESISCWAQKVGAGALGGLVAQRRLDELMEPHEPDIAPHREISEKLHQAANNSARDVGAEVVEVRVGALEPLVEDVKKERIVSWQTAWSSRAQREIAAGEAEAIREQSQAYASAQVEIIQSLAQKFREAVDRDDALSPQIVILRFMEALRQTWSCAKTDSAHLQVFKTWQALQEDLEKLMGHDYPSLPAGEVGPNDAAEDQT